jgi:hypothetical protein
MAEDVIKVIRDEMSDMAEVISKSINKLGEAEKHDKPLTKEICDGFKKLTSVIEKFKAIDLVPVVNIASDISKQNKSILDLLGRLVNNDGNGEIVKALTAMTSRSNDLIESALKKTDYSEQLNNIANALKKEEKEEKELVAFKIQRTQGGYIERVIPEYKENKK